MTVTATSATTAELPGPPTRCIAGVAVAVVVGGVLVAELVMAGPSLLTGVQAMAESSMGWLLVATAVACGSMVAFGAVRLVTLRAGGVRASLPATVAVSYAAGAIHVTVPAGGVFSSVYAYRRIRALGASTALATWSMAITGLLATATLAAVGLAGLALAGGSRGSAAASTVEIAAVVVVVGFLARITRRPETLLTAVGVGVRGVNSLRGRPAETGLAAVVAVVAGLQAVRPGWRHWAAAVTLSLLNWALDLACLAACCAACGIHVGPAALLLTYSVGMAAASLSPVPAGVGVTEAALVLGLTAAGASAAAALAAVIVYRVLSIGSIALIGWTILLANRDPAAVRSRSRQALTVSSDGPVDGDQRVGHSVETTQFSGIVVRDEVVGRHSTRRAGLPASGRHALPTRRVGGPRFVLASTPEGSS